MYASYGPCVRVVACGRQEWVSWRRNQQGTENRADNDSGKLASHEVQPADKSGSWRSAISKVENRADNESGELACRAASKNRAEKRLGRLILLYGNVES